MPGTPKSQRAYQRTYKLTNAYQRLQNSTGQLTRTYANQYARNMALIPGGSPGTGRRGGEGDSEDTV